MASTLKSYPPAWEGDLLLACRKCQKKLKGQPGMKALTKLKKTVKRHNKKYPAAALHLIGVGCMNLCPKGAVTICLPANQPPALSILRTAEELDALHRPA